MVAIGDREIRIERVLAAPRDQVWRALTDPKLLGQWWGGGHRVTFERLELQPGGHWRFVEHRPEGSSGFEGRFRAIESPLRLERTFEWDGRPGHVGVETLALERVDGGHTRVVSVSLFLTTVDRDVWAAGMERRIEESYAALDRVLARIWWKW